MANQSSEPFVLDFTNGQQVEDILKKADADYSKAEIDAKMASKANAADVYSKNDVDTALNGKVDKVSGKGLSTNDYTTADKEKLAGIEAQANKTVVDDTLDDSSTNPVQNKVIKAALDSKADTADIPTVPITNIQKNGTSITPVSGTVNITVPTQASDINAATATQGDKADTAIQGIKVNSSTVNPDVDKVVNITIPTTAADVSALPDTTKYATALSLTINSSTFVMTGQLKDQNGDNLGTAQTIDLPLESVVVGGSYNSQTQKVVLTLQNGNTIEFSVADLVSGLQTELSASNKLNPAYINYDSTHRAVSDTEKSAWNAKQNALTTEQLAAVNSGINSEEVAQIKMNKNNISSIYTQNGRSYNILDLNDVAYMSTSTTYSFDNATGSVVASCTTATYKRIVWNLPITIGIRYRIDFDVTSYNSSIMLYPTKITGAASAPYGRVDITAAGHYSFEFTPDVDTLYLCLYLVTEPANSNSITIRNFRIIPKSAYDAGFNEFVPHALSNAELTAKEQTNENNILYNANQGVKNIFDFDSWYNSLTGATRATITATTNGITLTATGNDSYTMPQINGYHIPVKPNTSYTVTLDSSDSNGQLVFLENDRFSNVYVCETGTKTLTFTTSATADRLSVRFGVPTSGNASTITNIMVQLASLSDTTYQPYAMSNAELTAAIKALQAQLANQ